MFARLVAEVYERATHASATPRVLDLGAGEGSATLPFLALGARVTAVDLSPSQLAKLADRCGAHAERLSIRCQDAESVLQESAAQFDVVVANSFLHHVPDYIALVRKAAAALGHGGQFFSFQDPLRYDTMPRSHLLFSRLAYASWRIWRQDAFGGLMRHMRRKHGVFREDSPHDNAEYHVMRNGVDHDAIRAALLALECDCEVDVYFSTQSRWLQPVGALLGIGNTFSIRAQRRETRAQ